MSVISREDAIAKIKDIPYVQEHPNIGLLFEEWLKSLPDADDGWISVEDRLPKIGNTVLATRFISKDHTYVDMSSYQGQDIGWKSNFDTYYGTNPYKVMAWRPLPKPYKPKEDTQ